MASAGQRYGEKGRRSRGVAESAGAGTRATTGSTNSLFSAEGMGDTTKVAGFHVRASAGFREAHGVRPACRRFLAVASERREQAPRTPNASRVWSNFPLARFLHMIILRYG